MKKRLGPDVIMKDLTPNATQIQNEKFIINRATPGMDADGSSPITGDVNMEEYAKWLKANYGLDIAVGP